VRAHARQIVAELHECGDDIVIAPTPGIKRGAKLGGIVAGKTPAQKSLGPQVEYEPGKSRIDTIAKNRSPKRVPRFVLTEVPLTGFQGVQAPDEVRAAIRRDAIEWPHRTEIPNRTNQRISSRTAPAQT
jgi:hypothetical protein